MSKEAVFLRGVFSSIEHCKLSALTWGRTIAEVIEPTLSAISTRAGTVVVDGQRKSLVSDCLPDNYDMIDSFFARISKEEVYECVRSTREEAYLKSAFEALKPSVVMPEEIAARIVDGSPSINEALELLPFAEAAIELGDLYVGDFTADGEKHIIDALEMIAKNIVTHVMLCASLDIDSDIEACKDAVRNCTHLLIQIEQIVSYDPNRIEIVSKPNEDATDVTSYASGNEVAPSSDTTGTIEIGEAVDKTEVAEGADGFEDIDKHDEEVAGDEPSEPTSWTEETEEMKAPEDTEDIEDEEEAEEDEEVEATEATEVAEAVTGDDNVYDGDLSDKDPDGDDDDEVVFI